MTIPPIVLQHAAPNLVTNGSAEADLTGISAANASTTISRVAHAPMTSGAGEFAVEAVCAGTASLEGVYYTTATGLGWTGSSRSATGSAWVEGAGNIYVWVRAIYTDATGVNSTLQTATLSGTPQRVIVPTLTTDPLKTLNYLLLYIRTNGAQAVTFHADAAKVEEGTEATPFADITAPGFLRVGESHVAPLQVGRG